MRYMGNGAVAVSPADVEAFASRWPCAGLRKPRGGWPRIVFTFNARGNLVDVEGEPKGADGSAMVALSQDAQAYFTRRREDLARPKRVQRLMGGF